MPPLRLRYSCLLLLAVVPAVAGEDIATVTETASKKRVGRDARGERPPAGLHSELIRIRYIMEYFIPVSMFPIGSFFGLLPHEPEIRRRPRPFCENELPSKNSVESMDCAPRSSPH